jgi:hypothetical protein
MAGAQAIKSLAQAIPQEWFRAEKIGQFSIGGGGGDVNVGGAGSPWDVAEASFAITGGPAGFTIPTGKGGVWRFTAAATIAIASGTRVTVAVNASGGGQIGFQFAAAAGAGMNETYIASGLLRVAAGEVVTMSVAQNSGSSANFGVAGSSRYATRFSAERVSTS